MKINVGIIGCGRIAGHHIRSILNNHAFQLSSVCDLNMEKAGKYGQEFNVPYYEDYNVMLQKHSEIDLVAVITPSGLHFHHAYDILTKYNKNLIIEKPTFLRIDHLDKCYQEAEQRKLKLFPVFQNRYNLAIQRVRNAVLSGELGAIKIASVRVRWCRTNSYYSLSEWRGTYALDGGALTNQGIHHIDLLRYLCGEVTSVSAKMRTLAADIEVEDAVVGHLEFSSGAIGTLEITTAARPSDFEASISLVCEHGLAQIGGIAVNELQIFTPNPPDCSKFSEDFSSNVYGNGHSKMYEEIASSFISGKDYSVSKADNYNTIKFLHSIYSSAENNGKNMSVQDPFSSLNLGKDDNHLASIYKTNLYEFKEIS